MITPIVKWVGGKRSIIDDLICRLPKKYNRYVEPCFGGGALFFAIHPQNAFISDTNKNLIHTYKIVKDNVSDLVNILNTKYVINHSKEFYYEIRDLYNNNQLQDIDLAAAFIYFNKTCYNGLYRVNKKYGNFNVPMNLGKIKFTYDELNLLNASTLLQNVDIQCSDIFSFQPQKNDFIYIDPPYDGVYNLYTIDRFDANKQIQLSQFCQQIHDVGGMFMLSNSNTDLIQSLYKDFFIEDINELHTVSCKKNQRKRKSELLIRNF